MKPPTNWGLTVYSEKHQWHMCCDGQDTQMEWLTSIFNAQHSDIWPPAGKARKQSITKNPRIGGLPLIPIQQEKNISKTSGNAEHIKWESGKLTYSDQEENDIVEGKKNLKQKAHMVAQCLERKEEKVKNHVKKHRSLICVEDTGTDVADLYKRPSKESRTLKKHENKTNKSNLESDKLPPSVIKELNTVLQKNRALHEET